MPYGCPKMKQLYFLLICCFAYHSFKLDEVENNVQTLLHTAQQSQICCKEHG
jgi:hypothetical protein